MMKNRLLVAAATTTSLLALIGAAYAGPATADSAATSSSCTLKAGPTLTGNPSAPVGKVRGTGEGPAVVKAVRSNGRWLLDRQGRVVILHGTNQIRKLPPYTPSSIGFGADDVAAMARAGFNTVRLGLIWKGLEPTPGHYDRAYLADLAGTVKLFTDRKINVVFDFHQDMYNEAFNGEGLPDWAVRSDGLPTVPNCGFPLNNFVMPALQRAWDHFWANDVIDSRGRRVQTAFADMWTLVAKQFRDDPYVVGYDIFNEPFPGSLYALCLTPLGCPQDRTLERCERSVMAAIRTVDPHTTLYYEPWVTFGSGGGTSMGDPGTGSSGFSFHDYCVTGLTGLGPNTPVLAQLCDQVFEPIPLSSAAQRARKGLGAPLLSEYGAVQDVPVIERTANAADKYLTSWQSWAWFNEDPSGKRLNEGIVKDPAKPPTGANLNKPLLDALTRPYPQAVAGTPTSFGYVPESGVFTLRYSTARVGGGRFPAGSRTVVAVPTEDYPKGAVVRVAGGRVASLSGQVLIVTSSPGATSVTVTVRRR
ncbi:MAG: endoglycoceramidase [Marmoricola sp.]|nr:endoglycoceramidase [Marmoricola sp.]